MLIGGHQIVRQDDRQFDRGFSLLELIVVLAIISIVSVIAAPRLANSASRFRAESAARRIKSDIELMRSRARSSSQGLTIGFDTVTDAYRINGELGLNRSANYQVELSRPPYQAEIVAVDFGGDALLSIDGYGSTTDTGRVVIRAGSEYRTVFVGAATQRVETGNKTTPADQIDIGGGQMADLK